MRGTSQKYLSLQFGSTCCKEHQPEVIVSDTCRLLDAALLSPQSEEKGEKTSPEKGSVESSASMSAKGIGSDVFVEKSCQAAPQIAALLAGADYGKGQTLLVADWLGFDKPNYRGLFQTRWSFCVWAGIGGIVDCEIQRHVVSITLDMI